MRGGVVPTSAAMAPRVWLPTSEVGARPTRRCRLPISARRGCSVLHVNTCGAQALEKRVSLPKRTSEGTHMARIIGAVPARTRPTKSWPVAFYKNSERSRVWGAHLRRLSRRANVARIAKPTRSSFITHDTSGRSSSTTTRLATRHRRARRSSRRQGWRPRNLPPDRGHATLRAAICQSLGGPRRIRHVLLPGRHWTMVLLLVALIDSFAHARRGPVRIVCRCGGGASNRPVAGRSAPLLQARSRPCARGLRTLIPTIYRSPPPHCGDGRASHQCRGTCGFHHALSGMAASGV